MRGKSMRFRGKYFWAIAFTNVIEVGRMPSVADSPHRPHPAANTGAGDRGAPRNRLLANAHLKRRFKLMLEFCLNVFIIG
jgi:hypothetical protein